MLARWLRLLLGSATSYAKCPPPAARHSAPTTAAVFKPNFIGDFPPEALAAWDKVNAALLRHITLVVDVEVNVEWKAIEGGYIGMGGSLGSQLDFPNAAFAGTWYPISLANQIAGTRLAPGPDVGVDMASGVPWDYSGDPPKALKAGVNDYVTTLMHEILHGMGFPARAWSTAKGARRRRRQVDQTASSPTEHRRSGAATALPLRPRGLPRFTRRRRRASPRTTPTALKQHGGKRSRRHGRASAVQTTSVATASRQPADHEPSTPPADTGAASLTGENLFWNGALAASAPTAASPSSSTFERMVSPSSLSPRRATLRRRASTRSSPRAGEKMPQHRARPLA